MVCYPICHITAQKLTNYTVGKGHRSDNPNCRIKCSPDDIHAEEIILIPQVKLHMFSEKFK